MPTLLTLLLTACSTVDRLADAISGEAPPDIVLITVDGLRADLPDQPFAEAAFLEGLAERWDRQPTLRFQAAYAQTISPYPSLVSLLVGRYPTGVPVCGRPAPDRRAWCTQVPDFQRTLPEVLSIYGYRSALTFEHLSVGPDLAESFSTVLYNNPNSLRPPEWEALTSQAVQWWGEGGPRFLMASLSVLEGAEKQLIPSGPGGVREPDERTWGEAKRRYQGLAREIGERVGLLLSSLDGEPYVIITSSHGTNLGEKGGIPQAQHNQLKWPTHIFPTDRTLRVPLLVFDPKGGETQIVEQPAELIDVFPTLTRISGALPPADLSGQDLQVVAEPGSDYPAYGEFGDMLFMRKGSMFLLFRNYNHGGNSMDPKLTERLLRPIVADDSALDKNYMLYDLGPDPLQEQDLFKEQKPLTEQLRQEMVTIRIGPAAPPDGTLNSAEVESLRSQGALDYW